MSIMANYEGVIVPSLGSLLMPYLLLVLIYHVVPPYVARCLRKFRYKQIFIGGIVVFYVVLAALCKVHEELPSAMYAFYNYARSPSVALLAVASSGFLVFTVWVFSSRTSVGADTIQAGIVGECGAERRRINIHEK
nr:hypothetical protein [Luteibacter rhizovicinus]